jgi:hypothetical protein
MNKLLLPEKLLLATIAAFSLLSLSRASTESYIPPRTHREDILLNSNWRFMRKDVAGAQKTTFDDSAWQTVTLPHDQNDSEQNPLPA